MGQYCINVFLEGDQEQKPRLPVDVVLKEETYHEDDAALERYNESCSAYYQSRSSSSREDTWTRQISAMMSKPIRPHMRAFLEKRGFIFL